MAVLCAMLVGAPHIGRVSAVLKALCAPWGACPPPVRLHARGMTSRNHPGDLVMESVGVFEAPKAEGHYDAGQLFLHKVFGYRGVVLFPWLALLYDRDHPDAKRFSSSMFPSRKADGKTNTYYQVLVDNRDSPHIAARNEAVTFLASQDDSRALYAIPGLDYTSHEDILPYSSKDPVPIQHQLFSQFFSNNDPQSSQVAVQETLWAWQEKNHHWLELSDVHRETTESLRVTAIPFYMGMRETQNNPVYWVSSVLMDTFGGGDRWRYSIRLENMSLQTMQLRERHWRIFSVSGTLETVRGRGVVGHEPVLSKKKPAFQYSSHVSLHAPSGHMWGTFRMEREDGYLFDCRIPPFSLESRPEDLPGYGT